MSDKQTTNDVFPEVREKEYKQITSEYREEEKDTNTKIRLSEIINPKIAYCRGDEELNIKLNINVKNEQEKRKNYNLNNR